MIEAKRGLTGNPDGVKTPSGIAAYFDFCD
jgi:hypothetical protein